MLRKQCYFFIQWMNLFIILSKPHALALASGVGAGAESDTGKTNQILKDQGQWGS